MYLIFFVITRLGSDLKRKATIICSKNIVDSIWYRVRKSNGMFVRN